MKGTIHGIILIATAAVVLTASPVPAARRAKPGRKAGVESINGNIVEGFRTRNVSRIISCYSERFMSSRYKSLEALADASMAILSRYYEIRLTRRSISSVEVRLPYAREVIDEVFVGVAAAPVEKTTIVRRKLVSYEKEGGKWLITGEEEIDREAEKNIRNGIFDDPEKGFRIAVPGKWSMHVIKTAATPLVVMTSPDMSGSLSVGRIRVPRRTTAKIAAENNMAATMELPGASMVDAGEVTLAGLDGYQITADVKVGGKTIRLQRSYFSDGRHLLFVIAAADSPAIFTAGKDGFEGILKTLELRDPKLDPAFGRVDGKTYRNDTYGCELKIPEGWDAYIEKSLEKFKLVMVSEDGAAECLFLCVVPRKDVGASLLVMSDEYNTRTVGVNYVLIDNSEVRCGNVTGYGSLSRFELAGRSRVKRRAYFRAGKYLFCLLANIQPAERYESKSGEIDALIKSIKLP